MMSYFKVVSTAAIVLAVTWFAVSSGADVPSLIGFAIQSGLLDAVCEQVP